MITRLIKTGAALLLLTGTLALFGCGSKSDGTNPAPATSNTPASSSQPDTTRPPGPAGPNGKKSGGVQPPPI